MEAIATLERWYRRVEPDGSCCDASALKRWAAAWLGLWPIALCVASLGGGSSWRRAAALASLTLVAGVGALGWWTCRAVTERAVVRSVAVAGALGASAVVVGLALRLDVMGGVRLHGWLVPPLMLMALPVVWDRSWDPSWAPSHRTVRATFVAALALGGFLACGELVLSRQGAARAVLPPIGAQGHPMGVAQHNPAAPWTVTDDFSSEYSHRRHFEARALGTRVEGVYATGLGYENAALRPRGDWRLSLLDEGAPSLEWSLDEPVEVLRDPRSGEVTLYSGERAARFRGATRVAAWRTVAGPRDGAVGLLAGAALGVALALFVWRGSRRAVAPFDSLASWRDGELSPDGTITPADGGATVRVSGPMLGRSGRVVFRGAAAEAAAGEPPGPYRDAARREVVEAHSCTSAQLAEMTAHVREAWAAWALVVATAGAAPLVVALLTVQ